MAADSEKIKTELLDRLSRLESRLEDTIGSGHVIVETREAIGRILQRFPEAERQMRQLLEAGYERGELRRETVELVVSVIDGLVSEQAPTTDVIDVTASADFARSVGDPREVDAVAVVGTDDALAATVALPTLTATFSENTAEERVQIGTLLRDRFLLQECIRAGGMGVVYKALDRRLAEAGNANPWVAIKVLSPELATSGHALRALQQEAAKGRRLAHPNIVRFIDFDRDDELYFIVLEWLEGRTLADILDSADAGSLDQKRAFEICGQIGQALDYAHRCGIVHADVKPANVMITPGGEARLFDFGIARMRQKTLEQEPDFDPSVLGLATPAYSSVEVLSGESPVPADDVFSLACLWYRLLAGFRVFGPRNALDAQKEGMEPQRVGNLSEDEWEALSKALSFKRDMRFGSMSEFIEAIGVSASDGTRISVRVEDRPNRVEHPQAVSRWPVVIVLAAGLLGIAQWQFDLSAWLSSILAGIEPTEEVVFSPAPDTTAESATIEAEPTAESPPIEAETVVPLAQETIETAVRVPPEPKIEEIDSRMPSPADAPTAEVPDTSPVGVNSPSGSARNNIPVLVDFAKLPPPTVVLRIGNGAAETVRAAIRLREDDPPVSVDLIRSDVQTPLVLRAEEVGFSGNRSPWATGQYAFSDGGMIEFPVGQSRSRIVFTAASDGLREADQVSTVRIREADSSESELAIITIAIEDDEQRSFESTVPANTVSFAAAQVSVREQDPAVQIDILRYNPDNTSLVVTFSIRDITASRGEDYFAPSGNTIEFGPGQRSARLLIPLVQDAEFEDNEAFSVEFSERDNLPREGILIRTAVLIRDDDF